MAPTGPINGAKPNKGVASNNVRQEAAKTATSQTTRAAQPEAQSQSATVASTLSENRKVLENAREQARQIDDRMIEDLCKAISEGRFSVDPHALAERIANDAAGADDLFPSELLDGTRGDAVED